MGQDSPVRQAREGDRLNMSQISKDDPVRELLKASNVYDTRIEWLWEEGFTTRRALGMLTTEAVDTLIASRADRGPTPLAQVLALKHVACGGFELGRRGTAQGNEAPRNPRRRIEAPRPQSAPVQPIAPPQALPNGPDGWSLEALRDLLNGHRRTPPSSQMNPRMDFEDPTTLMCMQGKHVKYYDITEYIPGAVVERERMPLGGEGGIILETGPRRPPLHKVSISQWNSANAKILDNLIMDGSVNINSIPDYLAYTQKINRMYDRYEWETVLLYDREYRQLEASVAMRWGTDVRHLSDVHLRDKPSGNQSHAQARRDRKAVTGGKGKQSQVDPKSGKELCIKYNKGSCNYSNCKFAHVCSRCLEGHPASEHQQGNGQ